jgi:hypothetical protein
MVGHLRQTAYCRLPCNMEIVDKFVAIYRKNSMTGNL